jgi:hypothetical protein
LFLEHNGLLMACPEYNSSITPLWKNTIDWVSRQAPGEAPLAAYKGKVATIMSASPGRLGGLRGLVTVRSIQIRLAECSIRADRFILVGPFYPRRPLSSLLLSKRLGSKTASDDW